MLPGSSGDPYSDDYWETYEYDFDYTYTYTYTYPRHTTEMSKGI